MYLYHNICIYICTLIMGYIFCYQTHDACIIKEHYKYAHTIPIIILNKVHSFNNYYTFEFHKPLLLIK